MGSSFPTDRSLALSLASACLHSCVRWEDGARLPASYTLIADLVSSAPHEPRVYLFVASRDGSIVLAFTGTPGRPDFVADGDSWQIDFAFSHGSGRVHAGFQATYQSIRPQLLDALHRVQNAREVLLGGHGIGGAIAILCALDLARNTPFGRPVCCTFGAPRVGDLLFCRAYNRCVARSIRVYNKHDIVPMLPGTLSTGGTPEQVRSYAHVRRGLEVSVQTGTIMGNHSLATYICALQMALEERH